MAVVLNATFASDAEGFSAGSQVSAEGEDFSTGYLSVGGGGSAVQAINTFTAISSGVVRVDFHYRIPDAGFGADTTRNVSFWVLPTGAALLSANTAAILFLSRNSVDGADANKISVGYRDGAGTTIIDLQYRGAWWKFSFVIDLANRVYDIWINDVEWIRGAASPNSTYTDINRLMIQTNAASAATHFDSIRVESAYVEPTRSVLVSDDFTSGSGAITASTPTDTRNIHAQPWFVGADTTYGTFTRSANGLVPETAKISIALAKCGRDGEFKATWKASAAGVIYGGLLFRLYAGPGSDPAIAGTFYWVRYVSNGAAGTKLRLFFGPASSATVLQSADLSGTTISASDTYTIKVIVSGRYIETYVNDVLQFGGAYLITDRGQLSEEIAGPYIDMTGTAATDNYCTAWEYKGVFPPVYEQFTVGNLKGALEHCGIREWYLTNSGAPQRSLGWSKGLIQAGHVSTADIGNDYVVQQTIYDGTHVKVYRQRGVNVDAGGWYGLSEIYYTILRRGIYSADQTKVYGATKNIAPDHDLRPELWSTDSRIVGATGAGAAHSDLPLHDWQIDLNNQALPVAFQRITSIGSGNEVRMTVVTGDNDGSLPDAVHRLSSMYNGDGGPISIAAIRITANQVDLTEYTWRRSFLIECAAALALADQVLTDFRDDTTTPATLSFTTGTLKTDAAGDENTDGFNERYGWHEITCAANVASWTLPVASGTRYGPAFRLHGAGLAAYAVAVEGVAGVAGTDYVLDQFGSEAVLQLLSNRTADTDIELAAAGEENFFYRRRIG